MEDGLGSGNKKAALKLPAQTSNQYKRDCPTQLSGDEEIRIRIGKMVVPTGIEPVSPA